MKQERLRETPICEWATPAKAIIVHDPVSAGAFEALNGTDCPEDFLFREAPERATYGEQHAALVSTLRRHVSDVYLLRELIGDYPIWARSARNPNQVFTRDPLITLM